MSNISNIERIIWYELVHAAYWEQYLSQYVSYKYDWRKWYNIIILILSTIGAASFSAWKLIPKGENIVPSIIFALMAVTQLIAVFQKYTVIDDETAKKLHELRNKYIAYLNKVENLYLNIRNGNISENEAQKTYFEIRETVYSIEELKDVLNIKKLKNPNKRGQYEMELRLHRKYGTPIISTCPKTMGLLSKIFKR